MTLNSGSTGKEDSNVSEISRGRILGLYPGLRPLAYRILDDTLTTTKRKIGVAQGFRSMESQLQVYKQGRSMNLDGSWSVVNRAQIVTNARPGLSWHCYGLAFDAAWSGNDPYLRNENEAERALLWGTYGKIGKLYGLKWGGDFHLINGVNDLPHLELTYSLTLDQVLELYDYGGIRGVWAFLDKFRGVPIGQDWGTLG